jgi:GxxExxY protein
MPAECPIHFPRLTTKEFADLDYAVMEHVFASHRSLGRLADEVIYKGDLADRLRSAGFEVDLEVPVRISFRTFVKTYFLDLVVNRRALYELKAVQQLMAEHEAQLMNYLLLLNASRGKLLNLRSSSIDPKFVNTPLTSEFRRAFAVDTRRWQGDATTLECVLEMLRDWGTALELPLYHQCLVHLFGGEESVAHHLPMRRGGVPLGNQRFHLLAEGEAFRLTAFNEDTTAYESQIKRLLKPSPLKALHWINIGHEQVTFITLTP